MTQTKTPFENVLSAHEFHPVIPKELQFGTGYVVDLTPSSHLWQQVTDEHTFADEIVKQAIATNAQIVIGRYAEHRLIYQDKENFSDSPNRTVHMAIDLGVPAGVPVYAPLDGEVYGIENHAANGDYGPTVILKHALDGHVFYTLYGHTATEYLSQLTVGQHISRGQQFTAVGNTEENGGWAPHLHFQIIKNMGDYSNDYPGVIDPEQFDFYQDNCPNPNLILKRSDLD
ncbi:peptidase M23 [Photobacterium sp. GB-27]|uniref:peptidoglycan DD-metalloendopeptidase family protein n=1 Tax=Photobacterium sp. GB-27 TaxID=2022109 RepID=UPI000D158A98|nr:peptidoglycan DD-metalloendopeptidase family protein [Photobacterium sp. GB-27]PSV30956.1 peptidase M23 [Photobacterium sp. GB-27]